MAETYTGSWGPETISGTEVTYDTFVALVDGEHTITHTVPGASQYRASITTKNGTTNGAYVDPSTVTVTETLAAGDVVQFVARRSFSSSEASGSWTVVAPSAPDGEVHTGDWGPTVAPVGGAEVASFTVLADGEHTITLIATATSAMPYTFADIRVNGTSVDFGALASPMATAAYTGTLTQGDVVTFRAGFDSLDVTVSGSWTIVAPVSLPPLPSNAVSPDQIDGVYIGNTQALAMYHGAELLWHRITTVIVAAPEFFEDDPWYTVPTQNGVIYNVTGTGGPGNTVIIAAVPANQYYTLSGQTEWEKTWAAPLPVVYITDNSTWGAQTQFRQACTNYGTSYGTVVNLPFQLDTSAATNLRYMFTDCASLTTVPEMDTSNVTNMSRMFSGCSSLVHVPDVDTSDVTDTGYMFNNCSSLTDGNARCIGKKSGVYTANMIRNSGLTREPFYNSSGQPI